MLLSVSIYCVRISTYLGISHSLGRRFCQHLDRGLVVNDGSFRAPSKDTFKQLLVGGCLGVTTSVLETLELNGENNDRVMIGILTVGYGK